MKNFIYCTNLFQKLALLFFLFFTIFIFAGETKVLGSSHVNIALESTDAIVRTSFNHKVNDRSSYGNGVIPCNTADPIPLVNNATFDALTTSSSTSGLCVLGCSLTNDANLVDTDLTNFATASTTVGAGITHNLRVTDGNDVFGAGTFAGYRIAPSGGLLSAALLEAITIKTYLGGVLIESTSGASLLNLSLLSIPSGSYIIGFNTNQTFDAIEISLSSLVGAVSTADIYYPVIKSYCTGSVLICNVPTAMNLPSYPVAIASSHTGVSGSGLGSVDNTEYLISPSTVDFATINLTAGLLASGSVAVKDQITDYSIGTYAGFEIENSNLVSISALGNITITTYLNGALQQQISGVNLLINGTLLNNLGQYKVGFVSTMVFDEVQLSINQTVVVDLGTTKVYSAVFEKFCAGPALLCNTPTTITAPTYPVFVNGVNTGISGILCASCAVTNTDHLIDTDTTNFAQISLTASIGASGSASIKDQITDYPAGTFAGFDIENVSLIDVNAFDAISVTTFLNGVQQETKSGNSSLIAVGTDLVVGTGRRTVGFMSTLPFDEVKITVTNLASLTLGTTKIYSGVFENFCPTTIECRTTYPLTNPIFPVFIDGDKSGISGVACVACAVNDTNNVLTASTTDFATISITAGVAATGSIAVVDQLFTYPSGTFAGFTIKDLNNLVELNLFQSLTVNTYNNGVLQESKNGSQLVGLTLVSPIFGSSLGLYNVGFKTSLPFDEIRIALNSLVSVVNNINVYGAFVNTNDSNDGGSGSLNCTVFNPVASNDFATTPEDTAVAIKVTTNDTDSDGTIDAATVDLDPATAGIQTTWTVAGQGTYTVSGSGVVTFTPVADFNGTATAVNYTVKDNSGLTSNVATITITITPLAQAPSISITKEGIYIDTNKDGITNAGDLVTYSFVVTNTGNVTLSAISVTDNNAVVIGGPIATLAVGATNTTAFTASHIITQADINTGFVYNLATVSATPRTGPTVTGTSTDPTPCTTCVVNPSCPSCTITPLAQAPGISITKEGIYIDTNKDGITNAGDLVTYSFVVTNTGNVTLSAISVTDNNAVVIGGPIATLAVGATNTTAFTASHIITQADINTGFVYNLATVSATPPTGPTVTGTSTDPTPCTTCVVNPSCPSCTITPLAQTPKIAIIKKGVFNDNNGDGFAQTGETITYTFTITNTGNVPLTNVTVTDDLAGVVLTGSPIASLGVGSTNNTAYTAVYVVTQADIIIGRVTNQAMVVGTSPQGVVVRDMSDDSIGIDDKPTVLPISGCAIEVFNAVSPNGDGENDVFYIRGLECYSDNSVEIYNRWGVLVFERDRYDNQDRVFRGVSEGRVTINQSQELPTGTYFYILKYKDSESFARQKSGYLYVSR